MAKRRVFRSGRNSQRDGQALGRSLGVERLEARCVLATVTVDTILDVVDPADNATSLREAIGATNAAPGADTIDFSPALTASGPTTIVLTQGELVVTDSLSIDGPGMQWLTIDASGNDPTPDENNGDGSRVLRVDNGNEEVAIDFALSGASLTGGDDARSFGGGAVLLHENGTLTGVKLFGNSAFPNHVKGGAVFAYGAYDGAHQIQVRILDSIIEDNFAHNDGGGLASAFADIEIGRSILRNNKTADDGGAMEPWEGSIRIWDSAFIGNVAGDQGGAIEGEDVAVAIENSVFSGNRAESAGGGAIYMLSGSLAVNHSTFTENIASSVGGGAIIASRFQTVIENSIVARNFRVFLGTTSPDDIRIALGSEAVRHSLIGHIGNLALSEAPVGSPDPNGNLIGGPVNGLIDPLLAPLAYNGGMVFPDGTRLPTHALLPGSPAIDMGDPTAAPGADGVPEFDQRGMPWSRVAGGRIDIGAIEWQANPLPGDYNFNGVVDAADYTVWRETMGAANDLRADGDVSGEVDQADYELWKANFGEAMSLEGAATRGALGRWAGPSEHERFEATGLNNDDTAERWGTLLLSQESVAIGSVRQRAAVPVGSGTLHDAQLTDAALLAWLDDRSARKDDALGADDAFASRADASEPSRRGLETSDRAPLDAAPLSLGIGE